MNELNYSLIKLLLLKITTRAWLNILTDWLRKNNVRKKSQVYFIAYISIWSGTYKISLKKLVKKVEYK